MSDRRKVVVLLSGGMDSVTALYHAQSECDVVAALSFNYGSKHNHKEIPFAQYHCGQLGIHHQVITMGFVNELFRSDLLQSGGEIPEGHYAADDMKQTVVPFRNGNSRPSGLRVPSGKTTKEIGRRSSPAIIRCRVRKVARGWDRSMGTCP